MGAMVVCSDPLSLSVWGSISQNSAWGIQGKLSNRESIKTPSPISHTKYSMRMNGECVALHKLLAAATISL